MNMAVTYCTYYIPCSSNIG